MGKWKSKPLMDQLKLDAEMGGIGRCVSARGEVVAESVVDVIEIDEDGNVGPCPTCGCADPAKMLVHSCTDHLKAENTLLRHALDRAKRINAGGTLLSVAEIHRQGHSAASWLDGESYGFDRCREGVTLLIDEVLASCVDPTE